MDPKPQTKTIDGSTYTANLLDAETALDVFERLMRLFGPAALEALAQVKEMPDDLLHASGDDLAKLAKFAPVVKALLGGAGKGELAGLVKDLCQCVTVKGADGTEASLAKVFAVHFQGRTFASMKVALLALQVNYADFFGGLGALLQRAAASAQAAASKSPST